ADKSSSGRRKAQLRRALPQGDQLPGHAVPVQLDQSLKGTLALTTTPQRRRSALLVLITMLAGTLFFIPSAVDAQSNPYQRGPSPTASGLERNGPYSVSTDSVSSLSARGFGGGDLYYPSGTSETFGG